MTDKIGPASSIFDSTPHSKKNFVPIRSVVYRKSLENYPELKMRKEPFLASLKSLTYKSQSGTSPIQLESPFLALKVKERPNVMSGTFNETQQNYLSKTDSTKDASKSMSYLKPIMMVTNHKLSVSGKGEKTFKKKEPLSKKKLAPLTKSTTNRELAPDDYFNLLFDENRKRFTNDDYEGIYDYTDEQVMNRIYNQGFRDPQYFNTRQKFFPKEAPDEQTIRDKYLLRLPVLVSTMENPKTLAAHVLGSGHDDCKYIESECEATLQGIQESRNLKDQTINEIQDLKRNVDIEMNQLIKDFTQRFSEFRESLQQDYFEKQTEGFKLQKDITILQRDKLNMEKEVDKAVPKLMEVENKLYGRVIFDLEAADENVNNITDLNLRPEARVNMAHMQTIH